jgi:hypothetical protein
MFQHPSVESLIRELGRNPALRAACGFASLPVQSETDSLTMFMVD